LFWGLSIYGASYQVHIYPTDYKCEFLNQLAGRAALGGEQALMTNFAGCLPKLSIKKEIERIQEMDSIHIELENWL
jgi:hypothetical protein